MQDTVTLFPHSLLSIYAWYFSSFSSTLVYTCYIMISAKLVTAFWLFSSLSVEALPQLLSDQEPQSTAPDIQANPLSSLQSTHEHQRFPRDLVSARPINQCTGPYAGWTFIASLCTTRNDRSYRVFCNRPNAPEGAVSYANEGSCLEHEICVDQHTRTGFRGQTMWDKAYCVSQEYLIQQAREGAATQSRLGSNAEGIPGRPIAPRAPAGPSQEKALSLEDGMNDEEA